MAKQGDPAGQRWSTFLRDHALHIAAMDLFVARPSASICSTFWSLSGWLLGSLSGSI
jgi:hypothetical protein